MLSRKVFNEQINDCLVLFDLELEDWKREIIYGDCRFLTDDVFKRTIKILINNCDTFSLPNILRSLPEYRRIDENGKFVNPPKKIEDYCKIYLTESYLKDKENDDYDKDCYKKFYTEEDLKEIEENSSKFDF